MIVTCINDKKLPEGASVTEGQQYKVVKSFINNWGQRVYIIEGIKNQGITSKGLQWYGYSASRFSETVEESVKITEQNYILNEL